MSKLDNVVINKLKLLCKEMNEKDNSLVLSSANIFYALFKNYFVYDKNNTNWFNQDRIVVNNSYLPLLYGTMHVFGLNLSLDNLKEFGQYNSLTSRYINPKFAAIGSLQRNDNIGIGVGIALGESYLNAYVKEEIPKNELINFHTYVVCTEEDLESGTSYESLEFAHHHELNKLVVIVNKLSSNKEVSIDYLIDKYEILGFEVYPVKNNLGEITDALNNAQSSKKPVLIIIKTNKIEDAVAEKESFEKYQEDLQKYINKRMSKTLEKWNSYLVDSQHSPKIKGMIEFLKNKKVKVEFKSENLKIGDNYKEDLVTTTSKMLNIYASKSPFILFASDKKDVASVLAIKKSKIMSPDNKLERNILFLGKTSAMGNIMCGLASLGFKVFLATNLDNANNLMSSIKLSTIYNLPTNYIFTNSSFLDTYQNSGIYPLYEINMLRMMPNLVTIKPTDINELMGSLEIISNYNYSTALFIQNYESEKLLGTNSKYVLAGAYRVVKEKSDMNGIIIATGHEVPLAIELEQELLPYGIDMRIISMPSPELFALQNNRYQNGLIPKEVKTFVIEFGGTRFLEKFATNKEYVFGLNTYGTGGTKEELLSHNNLDKDYIKSKIIELMKKSE